MQELYMGRQAVFDRNYQVVSYELLFRSLDASVNTDAEHMTAKVLVNAMMDIGLDKLVGDKQVHFNASESFLLSDVAEMLPVDQVGIEVLENVPVTAEVIAACKRLKEQGFTLLLDDVVYTPHLEPLIELADIVKVDVLKVRDLKEDVRALRKYRVKLLADKVETYEDYEKALALGFDYFQGYFFCKPEVVKGKTMADSKIAILRALQQVMVASDVSEIQDVVKQDVSLSYRLLKYINSPAFGMRREIDSIEQALVLLGLSNVRRWLSLLSLAALGEGKPSELIRSSLYRGYLLESVAKQLGEDETGDDFIMGMFSVLDALLDLDMATAIEGMALPKSVRDALLGDSIEASYKLKMVFALERGDWDEVLLLSQQYRGLRVQDLTGLHIEAITWADEQVAAVMGS